MGPSEPQEEGTRPHSDLGPPAPELGGNEPLLVDCVVLCPRDVRGTCRKPVLWALGAEGAEAAPGGSKKSVPFQTLGSGASRLPRTAVLQPRASAPAGCPRGRGGLGGLHAHG